jgi:hypothetical protein
MERTLLRIARLSGALAALAFTFAQPAQPANRPVTGHTISGTRTQTTKPTTDDKEQTQNFSGTIVSLNGELLVLRDDANDTWYHLDDQKAAGQFKGKKVSVTGTLDGRSDMIHVKTIEESKG